MSKVTWEPIEWYVEKRLVKPVKASSRALRRRIGRAQGRKGFMDEVRSRLADLRLQERIEKLGLTFEQYMGMMETPHEPLPKIESTWSRKRTK